MFNHVSDHMIDQERASVAQQRRSPLSSRARALVAAMAACASLVGCASATDVVATDKPGTYTVAASATGGRLAWARAHEHAVSEARDYCERRGMQSSVTTETVSGVQMMTAHASEVSFECHPTF
jgi:UDP-N-acetylglucosamine enolpyruvyl transferase